MCRAACSKCAVCAPPTSRVSPACVPPVSPAAAGGKALRRGVKEVVKALRKGEKGLCIIAADIFPVDVISHIPVFCEEQGVPYVYVRSKAELGAAATTKRPTSVVLINTNPKKPFDGQDKLQECLDEVKSITPVY